MDRFLQISISSNLSIWCSVLLAILIRLCFSLVCLLTSKCLPITLMKASFISFSIIVFAFAFFLLLPCNNPCQSLSFSILLIVFFRTFAFLCVCWHCSISCWETIVWPWFEWCWCSFFFILVPGLGLLKCFQEENHSFCLIRFWRTLL